MAEAKRLAEQAVEALGRGFDITNDFRLKFCRNHVIELNDKHMQNIAIPGGPLIPNVSRDIKCDKGERIRYTSDFLEFNQMSELWNQKSSIQGKIPSGHFNTMYGLTGSWQADATETKSLAFDGIFISLYNLHLTRFPSVLKEKVKKEVPSSWEPEAIARFIRTYGTHIIVGLEVGGQDVALVRQNHSSCIPAFLLKRHLENLGDQLFTESCNLLPMNLKHREYKQKVPEAFKNVFQPNPVLLDSFSATSSKNGLTVICSKRGGLVSLPSHSEWLLTVPTNPDVIRFRFMPITSLLTGVPGSGFLNQAINLYLRYKPPIDDLQYFLEFQVHLQWAPLHNELPLGPSRKGVLCPSIKFSLMGPKLYISTAQVSVGKSLVTGLRLYLEGMKCNRLAIHLQHLSTIPKILQPRWNESVISHPSRWRGSDENDTNYFEPVQSKTYSHVCTMPIQYDPNWASEGGGVYVVTGAQLQVKGTGTKNVLHLRLLFTRIPNCSIEKSVWGHAPAVSQRSGFLSTLSTFSSTFATSQPQSKPVPVVLNSAIYPKGPPVPVRSPKLLKCVETAEIIKGPQDSPGHWLLTAAKLDLDRGKISLHGEFSLLNYCT